jgi:RNA polymerase sigma-70 factor (ECF subfamily)
VRGFLDRLVRGHGGDDLAQETFLKAWRMASHYRGEGSYEGWLLRIAWRNFLSERRRAPPAGTMAADAQDSGAGAELRLDIARALASLPDRERAAALLCLGEGYSHAEAAAILEMKLGTLKSILARARAALVRLLESETA